MENLAAFFKDGGIFMYFILTTFLVGVAIIIERTFFLVFKYKVDANLLWEKIKTLINEKEFDNARALCNSSDTALLRVLDAGLAAAHLQERDIQNAVDEVTLEVIPTIEYRIPYLATLANIATLLGLLGTIQGLVQAFAAVGSADPSQKGAILASGISIALYTTAFGLIVAIPLLLMYTVLQTRAHRIVDEIDHFAVKLINLLVKVRNGA